MSGRPIADRRLWFTADKSRLVEEGDPRAAFLAAIPGREIPDVETTDEPEPASEQAEPVDEGPVSGLTIHAADEGVQEDEPAPEDDEPADERQALTVHVCSVCGKRAKTAAGLAAHKRSHDED